MRLNPRIIPGPLSVQNTGALDWGDNGLLAYGSQNNVAVVHVESLQLLQVLDGHNYFVTTVGSLFSRASLSFHLRKHFQYLRLVEVSILICFSLISLVFIVLLPSYCTIFQGKMVFSQPLPQPSSSLCLFSWQQPISQGELLFGRYISISLSVCIYLSILPSLFLSLPLSHSLSLSLYFSFCNPFCLYLFLYFTLFISRPVCFCHSLSLPL